MRGHQCRLSADRRADLHHASEPTVCIYSGVGAAAQGVTFDFSRPVKPTYNAYIEAFKGHFRAECFNTYWFLTLAGTGLKDGGRAQILQRGAPAWRDRSQASDLVDQSRRRHQPAVVRKAGNFTFGDPTSGIGPSRSCTKMEIGPHHKGRPLNAQTGRRKKLRLPYQVTTCRM